MKIKLLNCGGYSGFARVKFPVEVEAKSYGSSGAFTVNESELKRIGCDMTVLSDPWDPEWYFSKSEIEVVE